MKQHISIEVGNWKSEDIDELKDLVLSLERYPFAY
ncbi:hypothetical protein QE429_002952 [Bacillus sp. SORGH_AS 510]|nr:hypothetical protein [Bacillus sp. SORGH_AS_0510]